MLRIKVVLVAEFEGTAEEALAASGSADRAGLEVTWTGADDHSFRFVARPESALSWDRAEAIVEALHHVPDAVLA